MVLVVVASSSAVQSYGKDTIREVTVKKGLSTVND